MEHMIATWGGGATVMIQSYWRTLQLLSFLMHMFCLHYYVLDPPVLITHVADCFCICTNLVGR